MALTTCPDCQGAVSDAAPACIHCGAPLSPHQQASAPIANEIEQIRSNRMGLAAKTFLWLTGGLVLLVAIGSMNSNPEIDAARLAAQKTECSNAIASSIGTSTIGYTDKAAYDARVREACAGFEINGKNLANHGR